MQNFSSQVFVTSSELRSTMTHQGTDGIRIGNAIEALVVAKRMANCRPRYIESLKAYLANFARGREDRPLTSFNVLDVELWFASRKESLSTMASNIGRLSALFGFAERREWIVKNPCKQIERIRLERKAPKILTIQQVKNLVEFVVEKKPNELAFFALALFAGIRPEELEKITWDSVRLTGGKPSVTIDAAASKVRRRRVIMLEPAAVRLLTLAQSKGARLPVGRMTRRRYLDHVERVLGFETWPQDCLRHTAASYLLALHRDAGKVAYSLGNSPGILMRHYAELVSEEDALAFWSIAP